MIEIDVWTAFILGCMAGAVWLALLLYAALYSIASGQTVYEKEAEP